MRNQYSRREIERVIGPSIAYVPLTKGFYALIDSDDIENVNFCSWHTEDQTRKHAGYRAFNSANKPMSRYICACRLNRVVDHINRNPLDNRRCNLREATVRENNWNNGRGDMIGLKRSKNGKWRAVITIRGIRYSLGTFSDVEDAKRARRKAEALTPDAPAEAKESANG